MVAAGGGGGVYWTGTSLTRNRAGGAGGGLNGGVGIFLQDSHHVSSTNATGGSQTAGGRSNRGFAGSPNVGRFGIGGNGTNSCGAGGGYYGGGGGRDYGYCMSAGAGGSSFISGYSGCDAVSDSSTSGNIIHTGQPNHYSGLFFTNTSMTAGSNYGHGQVRITPMN